MEGWVLHDDDFLLEPLQMSFLNDSLISPQNFLYKIFRNGFADGKLIWNWELCCCVGLFDCLDRAFVLTFF